MTDYMPPPIGDFNGDIKCDMNCESCKFSTKKIINGRTCILILHSKVFNKWYKKWES